MINNTIKTLHDFASRASSRESKEALLKAAAYLQAENGVRLFGADGGRTPGWYFPGSNIPYPNKWEAVKAMLEST